MQRFVSPLLSLFRGFPAAPPVASRPQWRAHFDAKGVCGTCVVFEPASDRYLVFDEARARSRYLPASTFEIPAALIGIEVGSITDTSEVFHWDGKPRLVEAWERDHTLATGMRADAAWMFQEVARRTGKERMKEWLARLEYGNRDTAGGIDLFWLQGRLRVSAMEQVDFLRRLAQGELAMSQRSQRLVRDALVVEKTRAYTLYAKGGASATVKDPVSWWVGWVEKRGRTAACFAMNYTPSPKGRSEDRSGIARAILCETGALSSIRH